MDSEKKAQTVSDCPQAEMTSLENTLSQAQMLTDAEELLAEYACDYRRMAE